ncbi:hypothetical protein [Candidatus Pantoea multigeneris]|uniref:Uncharacterized protein n=1 Tax=Candidatus Pantoea multigeneris TaxID=2608357 RepID=A0ABX0RFA9_9GAMM|nr:hypothetical protein [Pantoea multigeneris]NIF24051.1 hypothetical protein [Pantoea multigeneris]
MNTSLTLPATASAVNPTGFDVPLSVIRDIAVGAEDSTAPVACWGSTDLSRLAAQAVWEFAQRTGACSPEESAATVIQDLLTDLMHLCDQEGITSDLFGFRGLVDLADAHYANELEEGV